MNKKNIELNDPITSSSDIVLGDIVEAVAKHLGCPRARGEIEGVVRRTIAEKENARNSHHASVQSVTVTRDGAGLAVNLGVETTSPACDAADALTSLGICKVSGKGHGYAKNSVWYNRVLQNGEVWTPYTNRRFLPAQYLRLMCDFDGNMSSAVAHRYRLQDCWDLMDTEIEKLIWLAKHWRSVYAERSQFLTVDDCLAIFREYLEGLTVNINNRGLCTFKRLNKESGEYWRNIQGSGRVVLWEQTKKVNNGDLGEHTVTESIKPTQWLIHVNAAVQLALAEMRSCRTYEKAYEILRVHLPRVSMGTYKDCDGSIRNWLPKRWKDCFLKAGAYYTLKSLIVNGHVKYATETGTYSNKKTHVAGSVREGLDALALLRDTSVRAYVVHAILKKSMTESRFNLKAFLRKISKR